MEASDIKRLKDLDGYIFRSVSEASEINDRWLIEHKEERSHESLGNLSPWTCQTQQDDLKGRTLLD